MRKFLFLAIVLLAIVAVAGCSDLFGGSSSDPVVGTWAMDGLSLSLMGMASGTVTVSSSNTYTALMTDGSGTPYPANGTWTKAGSTYSFTQTTPSTVSYPVTVSGSVLYATMGANVLAFNKL
jgi:hypothetical protein